MSIQPLKASMPREIILDDNDQISTETGVQVGPSHADPGDAEELGMIESLRTSLQSASATERLKVKVYKRSPSTGKMTWCDDIPPDVFLDQDLAGIRDRWGAGDYEIRLIGPKGIMKRITTSIAESYARNPVATTPTREDSPLAEVLRAVLEGQRAIMERLAAQPAAPAKDPMTQMMEFATFAKVMREAFVQPAAQNESPMSQLKELMQTAKELKATTRELADDAPPSSEPPSIMSMIPQVLTLANTALQQPQASQNPAVPIQPLAVPQSIATAQVAAPEIQTQTAATEQPADEPVEMLMLRQTVELLCAMARAGKDPETGGQIIFERLPDELLDEMDRPDWFDLVAQMFPIIKPHRDWLEKAKAEADKLFAEDGDDDAPSSAAPPQKP